MPEKKYDPEHHHHPGPAPFPVDRCADECDDQLPLFSQVGRGLQGDGFKVELNDGELIGYEVDPRTGEQTEIWKTKIEGTNGELSYSYHVYPWTNPKTFTMTFTYTNPDTGEILWTWTTPAIPYVTPEGADSVGSGVATLYLKKTTDGAWDWTKHEKLKYPQGVDHVSANTPNPNGDWTVNLTYGVGGDIDAPNTDDLAKIIGISPSRIEAWANNPIPDVNVADQDLKHYIDRKDDENVNTLNGMIPVGTIWLFGGAAAPNGWHLCDGTSMDKATYSKLYSVLGDAYGSDSLTFKLPNLCGRFPIGLGNSGLPYGGITSQTLGETGGEIMHTLTGRESGVREHYHASSRNINGDRTGFVNVNKITDGDLTDPAFLVRDDIRGAQAAYSSELVENIIKAKKSLSLNAYTAMAETLPAIDDHNNMPPYVTLNYIIKVM